jgi:hypothetical protein
LYEFPVVLSILNGGADSMAKLKSSRKVTYYVGLGIMIVGIILFLSTFLYFPTGLMGNFHMEERIPPFANSVIGIILIAVGGLVKEIGAKGTAGSGLLLNPDKAREDLKPFNEAKGGMINDVIRNIDLVDDIAKSNQKQEVIKIKCRSCGSLNDEDAKFCKSCGKDL